MKKKNMEIISAVYLLFCIIVIAFKLWKCFKEKDEKNCLESEQFGDKGERELERKEKEDLHHTFDVVNSMVNNCDQKAGILLTVVGVAITILATSDFLKDLRSYIFTPFVNYWTEENDLAFSCSRFTVFFLLLIGVAMLILSCHYLFKAISANIDYKKMTNEYTGLVKKSYIFFGTISEMSIDEFKKEDVNYIDDLKSQIYVNSIIANAKFQNYNKGLCWFKFLLWVSVMLFMAVMFMK